MIQSEHNQARGNNKPKAALVFKPILWFVFAIVFFVVTPIAERLDLILLDSVITHASTSEESHVALILVDDKSIDAIGRWPWPRNKHAELLTKLSSVNTQAIGFDILFVDADLNSPHLDRYFADKIAELGNVVLPIAPFEQSGFIAELMPNSIFAEKATKLGHVDLEVDSDGIVRQVYLYAGLKESRWPSFALSLAQLAQPKSTFSSTEANYGNGWTRDAGRLITYDDLLTIPQYSFIDVISGAIAPSNFNNKIVIVGVKATGIGERFATPLSENHQNITGVEINAHIVNAILNKSLVKKLPAATNYLLAGFILIGVFVGLRRAKATQLVSVFTVSTLATLLLCYLMLLGFHLWFAPSLVLLSSLFGFALFSFINAQRSSEVISQLHHDIEFDSITKLPNAALIEKSITQQIIDHENHHHRFPLLRIHIGKFKGLNDLLGKDKGDKVLQLMAKRISRCLTQEHTCGRHSGPEFTLIMTHTHADSVLHQISQTLHLALSEPFIIEGERFSLPISIGTCFYPDDGMTAETLVSCATAAMNRAKESAERGICHYHRDIHEQLVERNRFEHDLSLALESSQLEVYYQPQVDAKHGAITGVEALLRWHHPVKGFISPVEFIPVAETTGDIISIGNWVLETACHQAKQWGFDGDNKRRMGVNLSAIQFVQNDIVEKVDAALKASGLAPQCLELELTESCLVQDFDIAVDTLNQLKKMGVKLSIDDFGTGYSSLSYLKNFPMDRIKIDKAFINEVSHNDDVKEITLAIISMAHSLNMSVIAEGVENNDQQHFLNQYHCEELQGFYFGKPVSADQLTSLLQQEQ